MVNLLQLKLGYSCDILTQRVQPKEKNVFSRRFMYMTDLSHQAHMI
jgi:hypothetical protein